MATTIAQQRNADPTRDPDGLSQGVPTHRSSLVENALVEFKGDEVSIDELSMLNARELRFVEAVTRYGAVTPAAREIGLSADGALKWWHERPTIRRAAVLMRRHMTTQVLHTIELAAGLGAKALVEVLVDPDTPPGLKVKTAKIALDYSLKIKDLEIENQIDELRKQLEARFGT